MTTNAWELVAYILVSLVGLGAMVANSLRRTPEWLDEPLRENWGRLTAYSAIAGALLGGASFALSATMGWGQQGIVFASLGGYMFFQSLFTDFRVFHVERWGGNIALILSLATGCYIIATRGSEVDWIVYGGFVVGMFAIGMLPVVGNSDGRAFVYLAASAYPVGGIAGFQLAAIAYLVTVLLYFLGSRLRRGRNFFKGLLSEREKFPLVPIIMLAALLAVFCSRLL